MRSSHWWQPPWWGGFGCRKNKKCSLSNRVIGRTAVCQSIADYCSKILGPVSRLHSLIWAGVCCNATWASKNRGWINYVRVMFSTHEIVFIIWSIYHLNLLTLLYSNQQTIPLPRLIQPLHTIEYTDTWSSSAYYLTPNEISTYIPSVKNVASRGAL